MPELLKSRALRVPESRAVGEAAVGAGAGSFTVPRRSCHPRTLIGARLSTACPGMAN